MKNWLTRASLTSSREVAGMREEAALPDVGAGADGRAWIRAENLRFSYPGSREDQIRISSLRLRRGESCCLLGPSGCGKTSFLLLLAGLLKADAGSLNVGGVAMPFSRSETILLLQEDSLLPWKTLADNAAFPLRYRGYGREAARARVNEIFAKLGIASASGRYPGEASGGEKQRAAVARALLLEADLLLMDEPCTALDPLHASLLQEQIIELWRERRFTLLFVSHQLDEALKLGQRLLVMRKGEMVLDFENPFFDGGEGAPECRAFQRVRQKILDAMRGEDGPS